MSKKDKVIVETLGRVSLYHFEEYNLQDLIDKLSSWTKGDKKKMWAQIFIYDERVEIQINLTRDKTKDEIEKEKREKSKIAEDKEKSERAMLRILKAKYE